MLFLTINIYFYQGMALNINNVQNKHTKTIEWLLEKNNPSVRYYTLLDLLGKSADDKEVIEAKKAIYTAGVVPEILKHQNEGGFWEEEQKFYIAKYKGTVWQLIILAELGADCSDPRIRNACEFILQNSQEPESFAFAYRKRIKDAGGNKSEIIPCLTGNMVWSLIKLGLLEDTRVQKGIEWICKYQRADDQISEAPSGWPYDRYKICWGKHTCHMGVVKSLKALSAIPKSQRNKQINEKIDLLADYIFKHHIFRKSHDLTKISKPGWLRLSFPLMYQTDILEIAGILLELGYHDQRIQEAVSIIEKKQSPEGRWKLENTFNGRFLKNIETKGKDSKWITLKALKVLMKY